MQPIEPEYRGSARTCPICDGAKIICVSWDSKKDKDCETCLGTGVVHTGVSCEFCGRSVQYEYKEFLICGSSLCQAKVDEKIKSPQSVASLEANEDDVDFWRNMYGLI